jgi:N-acetylmuramic acid 6-phosphate etherase
MEERLVLTTREPLDDLDLRPTVEIVRAVVRGHGEVLAAVTAAEPAIAALADLAAERNGRVIYVGAGSGGRIAALDASEWGPTFGEDRAIALLAGADEVAGSRAEAAAEDDGEAGAAAIRALDVSGDDVVVGVTASGTTPYVLGALAAARGRESAVCDAECPLIAAVTCAPIAAAVDHEICVRVGPEAIEGSTRLKAGTAQKLVLNAFSTAVMVRRGRTYGRLMAGMRVANAKLRARAVSVLVTATACTEEQAQAALAAARDDVGQAIVMLVGSVDAATAEERLRATQGAIRRATEKWS